MVVLLTGNGIDTLHGVARFTGKTSIEIVGIFGFLVMFGGVTYAVLGPSGTEGSGPQGVVNDSGHVTPHARQRGRGKTRGESFMQRMEDRWDKRKDGGL